VIRSASSAFTVENRGTACRFAQPIVCGVRQLPPEPFRFLARWSASNSRTPKGGSVTTASMLSGSRSASHSKALACSISYPIA